VEDKMLGAVYCTAPSLLEKERRMRPVFVFQQRLSPSHEQCRRSNVYPNKQRPLACHKALKETLLKMNVVEKKFLFLGNAF
jgi:hypothetical protein